MFTHARLDLERGKFLSVGKSLSVTSGMILIFKSRWHYGTYGTRVVFLSTIMSSRKYVHRVAQWKEKTNSG